MDEGTIWKACINPQLVFILTLNGDKLFLSWSGGKDCCMSLHYARLNDQPVRMLLTTINEAHQRISMHGVRTTLLNEQAKALGLPLHKVLLPEMPGMNEYENAMHHACMQMKSNGFTGGMFGDIFLTDLKEYRETQMNKVGLNSHFPLWEKNTRSLMQEFITSGYKAIVVCIDNKKLDKHFCGRLIDENFLNELPDNVDPCGENGEYHSFVFDGPGFIKAVNFTKGEIVYREYPAPSDNKDCFTKPKPASGFYFCDLLP
jgi:uncharacterized protein (TIGR00290 family)